MIKATMFCVKSRQLPMLQVSGNCFFPFNPSLQEELKRLFTDDFTFYSYYTNPYPNVDDVMEEFRHNGRDFEYCPDVDDYQQPVANIRRKKPKKPLPNVCVFCRNNGVEEIYYRQHLIKYADGRVQCPVLRAYTCPICGATGDTAHTVSHCPMRSKNSGSYQSKSSFETISTTNDPKLQRNSIGKRRQK
ncbi:uncharacterized protein LOC118442549 [Vespa mandarinia]|uniref:uncharacterized protein LOC118442549 n=1 Tax=Vespa mandarinia TaxID=7446 RepID=UPI001620908D|nr:uncharacterized protein LOC118442549 [Vespa mandarinia]XP_047369227.1 uncharacterized protein LOC124956894 [Vespa velutina]